MNSLKLEIPVTKEEINHVNMTDIPIEKVRAMQQYAVGLRKRHPKMKPERVQKLTAAKFNITLL